MSKEKPRLCFRCEHRASGFESGHYPRFECGNLESSVCGCYMYKPCLPVVMTKQNRDRRPAFAGAMLSARMSALRLAKTIARAESHRHGHTAREYLVYHDPQLGQW